MPLPTHGVKDFVLRVNVVALPVPYEEMSLLPGDTRSDGYPCVAVLDKVAILAVPTWSRSARTAYHCCQCPCPTPRCIAAWAGLVRGPASSNVGPVLAGLAWPVLEKQINSYSESEEDGKYMFLSCLVNSK